MAAEPEDEGHKELGEEGTRGRGNGRGRGGRGKRGRSTAAQATDNAPPAKRLRGKQANRAGEAPEGPNKTKRRRRKSDLALILEVGKARAASKRAALEAGISPEEEVLRLMSQKPWGFLVF